MSEELKQIEREIKSKLEPSVYLGLVEMLS